jgi:DNA-binding IclR family transcriptional regulator
MPPRTKTDDTETTLPGVAAVSRALSILSCFQNNDEGLSLAEISRRTGMYKSTVLRLAESLEAFQYLSRDADGNFKLSVEVVRLGALARRTLSGSTHIERVLHELKNATGESATYYVKRNDMRLALYRVDSSKSVRDHINVGDTLGLSHGAAGTILMTRGEPASGSERFRTVTSLGERDPEVAAVAGPVYVHGRLEAALSVSGPISRFSPERIEEIARCVSAKSEELSELLSMLR